jgi:hypothetical protein
LPTVVVFSLQADSTALNSSKPKRAVLICTFIILS